MVFRKVFWVIRTALLGWGMSVGMLYGSGFQNKLHGLDAKQVEITVSSFTDVVPTRGWAELEVQVRNRMSRHGTWQLNFSSEYGWQGQNVMTHSRVITVPPQSVRNVRLEVPVYPMMGPRHYWVPGLRVQVVGPGSKRSEQSILSQSNSGHHGVPASNLAVSPGVRVTRTDGSWDWNELTKEVQNQGIPLNLLEVELDVFPLSQKGLVGIHHLLMTKQEWDALRPHHVTLRRWVAQGGHLFLYGSKKTLPERVGLGTIRSQVLNSSNMVKTAREFTRVPVRDVQAMEQRSFDESKWPLRKMIPDLDRPVVAMVLAVIAIAAVLGPINLGLALRRRNSFQVLWTTPAISVGISVLLGVLILLGDGIGGKGTRMQWTLLMPEERLAYTWQEQVSRTGLLLSTRSTLPENWLMLPVSTQHSDDEDDRRYSIQVDGSHTGDWFANRRVQAQVLQHAGISRSSVAVNWKGDVPWLTSTFSHPLIQVLYRDDQGTVWMAKEVHPGSTKALRPTNGNERKSFLREIRHRKTSVFPGNDAVDEKGWFYAEVQDPEAWVETLSSVRWENQNQWVFGPVVETSP